MLNHNSPHYRDFVCSEGYGVFARGKAVSLLFELFAVEYPEARMSKVHLPMTPGHIEYDPGRYKAPELALRAAGLGIIATAAALKRDFEPIFNRLDIYGIDADEVYEGVEDFCYGAIGDEKLLPKHPFSGERLTVAQLLPPEPVVGDLYVYHEQGRLGTPDTFVDFLRERAAGV